MTAELLRLLDKYRQLRKSQRTVLVSDVIRDIERAIARSRVDLS